MVLAGETAPERGVTAVALVRTGEASEPVEDDVDDL
jgi:hypothetical protein